MKLKLKSNFVDEIKIEIIIQLLLRSSRKWTIVVKCKDDLLIICLSGLNTMGRALVHQRALSYMRQPVTIIIQFFCHYTEVWLAIKVATVWRRR